MLKEDYKLSCIHFMANVSLKKLKDEAYKNGANDMSVENVLVESALLYADELGELPDEHIEKVIEAYIRGFCASASYVARRCNVCSKKNKSNKE